MPEYLHPGVYVEETSFRAKSIEGVATSTTGFVGQCRFGPTSGPPALVTSFEEFRRQFGGLDDLVLDVGETTNYLAHAARAFFDEGGERLYVARVFVPETGADSKPAEADAHARTAVPGTAVDPSTSQITITMPTPAAGATASSPLADGKASVDVTVLVLDQHDDPVQGVVVELFVPGEGNIVDKRRSVSDGQGNAKFKLRSVAPGDKSVAAIAWPDGPGTVAWSADPQQKTTFAGDAPAKESSTIAVGQGDGLAVGDSTSVTVVARDAYGNGVPNCVVKVAPSTTDGVVTPDQVTTNAQGTAAFVVTGKKAADVKLTATVTPPAAGAAAITLPLVPVVSFFDPASPKTRTLPEAKTSTVKTDATKSLSVVPDASGALASANITVTVRDAKQKTLPNKAVVLSVTGYAHVTQPASLTDPTGVVNAKIESRVFGTVYVSASVEGVPVAGVWVKFEDPTYSDPKGSDENLSGLTLMARFPGRGGHFSAEISARRTGNLNVPVAGSPMRTLTGVRSGDLVEISDNTTQASGQKPKALPLSRRVGTANGSDPIDPKRLYFVRLNTDGSHGLVKLGDATGTVQSPASLLSDVTYSAQRVVVNFLLRSPDRIDSYDDVSLDDDAKNPRFLGNLHPDHPPDPTSPVYVDTQVPDFSARLADFLAALPTNTVLIGGSDGVRATANEIEGTGELDADPNATPTVTGLKALDLVEDIAIVAAPGGCALTGDDGQDVRNKLIEHCENKRYRVAILSVEADATLDQVRHERGKHDSSYAALYYPWVTIRNPLGDNPLTLDLPPDGFMAGIWARNDEQRGVHKAPANEIVRSALRFKREISQGVQDVLNPEGINALRNMDPRGYRVWGARTISSDPEWHYLSVRRLFVFLERSIDVGTQWVVFEPNNEETWLKVRLTVEAFLKDVWRSGALMGGKPEEAFFVRCDRKTMTQHDLDNGRLICLIGVAPVKPAEFVIFRIGQWTAEAEVLPRGI